MLERIRRAANKAIDRYTILRPRAKQNSVWYGNDYGGFYLNPDLLSEASIVYSVGIGEDISFDEMVINQIGCNVFAFDPTPKSIAWVKQRDLPANFQFYEFGLGAQSGVADFYLPANENQVSGSIHTHGGVAASEKIAVNIKTLSDLMETLAHDHIDVLKIDIEGAEYDVVADVLSHEIPITQLLIEFHSRFFPDGRSKTRNSVKQLTQHGYQVFAVSDSGDEVSFIRRPRHSH